MIVLAGDIGGTNSRLALYDGLQLLFEKTYPSAQQASLEAAAAQFLVDARASLGPGITPARACLAVAGPIEGHMARITNLPWLVDARRLQAHLEIANVRLANDFEAAAVGVPLLAPDQLVPIGGGPRNPTGPMVVTGPGTGLGQAFLHWSQPDSRYHCAPSEAGHADFAPRTPMEWGLCRHLAALYGRVSYERVISGPAFKDLFAYLMTEPALRALATGGVFIAGGIAPRIKGILQSGPFREAFEAKGRLRPVLTKVPIFVVTSRELGLLGAAALAVA
ncbi:MAG TPA: glucokinase [Polyangia bacterium]|nr:glucokinase [Polyangia bacterium]